MTQQELRTLVDYHFWAIDRLLTAAETLSPEQFTRDLASSFPSVRDTLVHLHWADWIWLSRLQGASPRPGQPADGFPDVRAARAGWHDIEIGLRAWVDGPDGAAPGRVLEYRVLSGKPDAMPVGQIIQHVVNHGTYHRGQITTMLRQLQAAPPQQMDLIAYYRAHGR